MTAIIVKPHQERVDHPSRRPDWERANAVGKARYESMQFESESQRSDYLRRVNSNPENIPGLPEFFPPLIIREGGGRGTGLPKMSCGHDAVRMETRYDADRKILVNVLECGHGHSETQKEEML